MDFLTNQPSCVLSNYEQKRNCALIKTGFLVNDGNEKGFFCQ